MIIHLTLTTPGAVNIAPLITYDKLPINHHPRRSFSHLSDPAAAARLADRLSRTFMANLKVRSSGGGGRKGGDAACVSHVRDTNSPWSFLFWSQVQLFLTRPAIIHPRGSPPIEETREGGQGKDKERKLTPLTSVSLLIFAYLILDCTRLPVRFPCRWSVDIDALPFLNEQLHVTFKCACVRYRDPTLFVHYSHNEDLHLANSKSSKRLGKCPVVRLVLLSGER
jgi:hypothetical protein